MNRRVVFATVMVLLAFSAHPWSGSLAGSSISSTRSVIFTQVSGSSRFTTILPDLLEMVSDGHYRSRASVAPGNSYVVLSQAGSSLGGCWSDADGFLDFSLSSAPAQGVPIALSFGAAPTTNIAPCSIHRLTRTGAEAWPSLSLSQSTVWLARTTGEHSVGLTSWARATGEQAPEVFSVGSELSPARRPSVVSAQTGEMLLFCDRLIGAEYVLQRFSPPAGAETVVRSDSFPHAVTSCAISSSSLNVRYTRTQGGITYLSDHEMYFRSAGDSATLLYMPVPLNMSHVSITRASNGILWTAGAVSGRVTVYRGQQEKASFDGLTPVVFPVVSGSTRLVGVISSSAAAGRISLTVRWYDLSGFPVGTPRQVMSIPADSVSRMTAAAVGDTMLLVAWSQIFSGREQVFMSTVDVRP